LPSREAAPARYGVKAICKNSANNLGEISKGIFLFVRRIIDLEEKDMKIQKYKRRKDISSGRYQ